MITKVISSGQIGADIAGVRAAKTFGLDTGGYMPRDFKTKFGSRRDYARLYGMIALPSDSYAVRTSQNVKTSDGTIRFAVRWNSPGELATIREIRRFEKPYFDVDVDVESNGVFIPNENAVITKAARWLAVYRINCLNVAGNAMPQIEGVVENFLHNLFVMNHERV